MAEVGQGRPQEASGNERPRGMTAERTAGDRSPRNRTRLTSYCDRAGGDSGLRRRAPKPTGYCAANTNGTFTVVCPLEAGKRQRRTRLVMHRANPRYPRGSPLLLTLCTLSAGAT